MTVLVSVMCDPRFAIQSQTLIVLSSMPPLTILEPSGENWTEEMEPRQPSVCAFGFSLIKVRESVGRRRSVSWR